MSEAAVLLDTDRNDYNVDLDDVTADVDDTDDDDKADGLDPDEPRDESGKWTTGGGNTTTTVNSKAGAGSAGSKTHLIEHTTTSAKDAHGKAVGVRVTVSSENGVVKSSVTRTLDGRSSGAGKEKTHASPDEAVAYARTLAAGAVAKIEAKGSAPPSAPIIGSTPEEKTHARDGWKAIASYKPDTSQVVAAPNGSNRADLKYRQHDVGER